MSHYLDMILVSVDLVDLEDIYYLMIGS